MKTSSTLTYSDTTTDYAHAVVSGEIVAGPYVRLAAKRHLEDLKTGVLRGLRWNVQLANRFFAFCEQKCVLAEGQFYKRPLILEPSQRFITGSLFGWQKWSNHHNDWVRRFNRAYVEQGKGNGKSPLAGAIGIYGMTLDGEHGAEIYAAGATKEQAGILFRDAVRMREQSKWMSSHIELYGSSVNPRQLWCARTKSRFLPVSREAKKTGSGPRPHMALVDEMHEHPDAGIVNILEAGFKFRKNPLLFIITNSGSNRNSACWQERETCVRILEGEVQDDSTFGYICALDEDDDPLNDPSCWIKVNPLLGVTITEEYLADKAKQAREQPGKTNINKRLHFCIWTDADQAWLPRQKLEICEDAEMTLSDFTGEKCYAGVDLSQRIDLTARALVFEDGMNAEGEPCYAAFVHAWTPKDTLDVREQRDQAPYSQWVDAGFLTAIPGEKIKLSVIANAIKQDCEMFDMQLLAYDNYNYKDLSDELELISCFPPVADHPQGFLSKTTNDTGPLGQDSVTLHMPGSIDELETLINDGRIRIHVNPVFRSAYSSATFADNESGQRRFSKIKATGRIDVLVALANAIGAAKGMRFLTVIHDPWENEDYSLDALNV